MHDQPSVTKSYLLSLPVSQVLYLAITVNNEVRAEDEWMQSRRRNTFRYFDKPERRANYKHREIACRWKWIPRTVWIRRQWPALMSLIGCVRIFCNCIDCALLARLYSCLVASWRVIPIYAPQTLRIVPWPNEAAWFLILRLNQVCVFIMYQPLYVLHNY